MPLFDQGALAAEFVASVGALNGALLRRVPVSHAAIVGGVSLSTANSLADVVALPCVTQASAHAVEAAALLLASIVQQKQ